MKAIDFGGKFLSRAVLDGGDVEDAEVRPEVELPAHRIIYF